MPEIDVEAWVLDDTGFPKDGKHSPGVKRQYSGTLGKIGNCQIGVSVHAVGEQGHGAVGWALYLPEEWCDDPERRREGEDPRGGRVQDQAASSAVELVERAAGWEIPAAPVLGDARTARTPSCASACTTAGCEYVLSVSRGHDGVRARDGVRGPRAAHGAQGRPKTRPQPDREPEAIGELIARLGSRASSRRSRFRDGPDGKPMHIAVRVRARPRRARLGRRRRLPAPRGMADRRVARRARTSRPTTGSPTCPPPPSPNGSPGSPGCAGRSSSTTGSSRASSGSTTTKAAPGSAGITTPRWSPPPTGS